MNLLQLFDIKTRTLGFAFCQPPKKSLPRSLTQKSHMTTKFQTQKKSSDRKFQTQKRALHIPVTYISVYPPPPLPGLVRTAENGAFRKHWGQMAMWSLSQSPFDHLSKIADEFMLMLVSLLSSSFIACLELNVALYKLNVIAQIVCFPQKLTTQEGENRERR